MPGAFTGVTDSQWEVLSQVVRPIPYKFGRGRPDVKKLLNTILYVLITGCRWCDVPVGSQWGKRSTAHKYLGIWSEEGTLDKLRRTLLELAELSSLIDWSKGSIDGSFSPWERRRRSG
jgi:transposase